jgi:hypothetical protein
MERESLCVIDFYLRTSSHEPAGDSLRPATNRRSHASSVGRSGVGSAPVSGHPIVKDEQVPAKESNLAGRLPKGISRLTRHGFRQLS